MELRINESTLPEACAYLAEADTYLHKVVRQFGNPPLWLRPPNYAGFVHIVLEQQVSLASALATFNKLQAALGQISPENFLTLDDQDLRRIGFSRQKSHYSRALATAALEGKLDFDRLHQCSESELILHLKQFKGIGDWTAQIIALMCFGFPDVLPKGDIALYEAYKNLYGLTERPTHAYFVEHTLHWQPFRSVGARILWHFYLCERKLRKPS